MTNLFADLRAAGLAGDQNRAALVTQSPNQSPDLGGFTGPFAAFKRDKCPFFHNNRWLQCIIIGRRLAGQEP